MSDVVEPLERLGLSQYLEAFLAEGFDTWDTVLDITESDLCVPSPSPVQGKRRLIIITRSSLNVKLGHRRVCNHFTFACMARNQTADFLTETSKGNRRVARAV